MSQGLDLRRFLIFKPTSVDFSVLIDVPSSSKQTDTSFALDPVHGECPTSSCISKLFSLSDSIISKNIPESRSADVPLVSEWTDVSIELAGSTSILLALWLCCP